MRRGIYLNADGRWTASCMSCGRSHLQRPRMHVRKSAERGAPLRTVCAQCPPPETNGARLVHVQCTTCKQFEEKQVEPDIAPSECGACARAARAVRVIQAAERLRVAKTLADMRAARASVERGQRELQTELARAEAVISILRSENNYYELNFCILHQRVLALEASWAERCPCTEPSRHVQYSKQWPSLKETQVRVLTKPAPPAPPAPSGL